MLPLTINFRCEVSTSKRYGWDTQTKSQQYIVKPLAGLLS